MNVHCLSLIQFVKVAGQACKNLLRCEECGTTFETNDSAGIAQHVAENQFIVR